MIAVAIFLHDKIDCKGNLQHAWASGKRHQSYQILASTGTLNLQVCYVYESRRVYLLAVGC